MFKDAHEAGFNSVIVEYDHNSGKVKSVTATVVPDNADGSLNGGTAPADDEIQEDLSKLI